MFPLQPLYSWGAYQTFFFLKFLIRLMILVPANLKPSKINTKSTFVVEKWLGSPDIGALFHQAWQLFVGKYWQVFVPCLATIFAVQICGQSWETWAKPTCRFENGEQKETMHRNESCKVETTSPLNSDLRFGDQPWSVIKDLIVNFHSIVVSVLFKTQLETPNM